MLYYCVFDYIFDGLSFSEGEDDKKKSLKAKVNRRIKAIRYNTSNIY